MKILSDEKDIDKYVWYVGISRSNLKHAMFAKKFKAKFSIKFFGI